MSHKPKPLRHPDSRPTTLYRKIKYPVSKLCLMGKSVRQIVDSGDMLICEVDCTMNGDYIADTIVQAMNEFQQTFEGISQADKDTK